MKKIIILIFALFISYNISFASNCKEEIIKNATNPVFSEDGKSFAYILLNDDGTKSVVINGVKGKNYHNINTFIYISKNGNSISYIAELKDGKNIVVKDGIEGKQYDLIVDNLIKYSEDGKHFAYIASKNGKQFIVKDGVEGKQYEQIATFYLSLNGKNIIYIIVKKDGKQNVIKDGIEGKQYDYNYIYDTFRYSSEANSYVFTIIKNKKVVLIKDGLELKEYEQIYDYKFSPDGKHFVYKAVKNGKEFIVKDGIELNKYDFILDSKFSLDGKHFAYVASKDGKVFVVIDGIEGKKYKSFITLVSGFENFIYKLYNEKNKVIIVKDGIESAEYDNISQIIYSENGKYFAYLASKDGKEFIVKDGIELNEYGIDEISKFIYSKDGKHFAYKVISDGKTFIIKDGEKLTEYNGIYENFNFSSDGKHFVYKAVKDGNRPNETIVMDGKEGNTYDTIFGFYFLNDGTLYYDTINAIVKRTCSENIKNEEINNKIVDEKEVERRKYVSMYIQAKLSLIGTNDNYINKIDVLVSKYDNIKLEKLFNKVKNIQNKNNILKYLEAKIYLKLNNKEVEEFNQSTDENAKYVTEYTINETSDKNAKTILEKYGFSGIKETVETQFGEDMLKKQLVLAILWEYHIKDYKYLKDNPVAYKEYLKGLEEIEEYKTK